MTTHSFGRQTHDNTCLDNFRSGDSQRFRRLLLSELPPIRGVQAPSRQEKVIASCACGLFPNGHRRYFTIIIEDFPGFCQVVSGYSEKLFGLTRHGDG